MSLQNRIRKLESKSIKDKGWYSFDLLEGETIEGGRKRVGIPENAQNIIAVRNGLPPDQGDFRFHDSPSRNSLATFE